MKLSSVAGFECVWRSEMGDGAFERSIPSVAVRRKLARRDSEYTNCETTDCWREDSQHVCRPEPSGPPAKSVSAGKSSLFCGRVKQKAASKPCQRQHSALDQCLLHLQRLDDLVRFAILKFTTASFVD